MTEIARLLAGWAGGLAFVAAAAGGLYLTGRHHGGDASDDRWRAAMVQIEAELVKQQDAQRARAGKLAAEVETLRRRPEVVRTVTTEVVKHVVADADCASLPGTLRQLWDAGSADPDPASAAGVGDAALPRVAEARR
jgi:TPP-dependent trihydroxycyclohexane-1,2-dione (THcHDO) dehydratase